MFPSHERRWLLHLLGSSWFKPRGPKGSMLLEILLSRFPEGVPLSLCSLPNCPPLLPSAVIIARVSESRCSVQHGNRECRMLPQLLSTPHVLDGRSSPVKVVGVALFAQMCGDAAARATRRAMFFCQRRSCLHTMAIHANKKDSHVRSGSCNLDDRLLRRALQAYCVCVQGVCVACCRLAAGYRRCCPRQSSPSMMWLSLLFSPPWLVRMLL